MTFVESPRGLHNASTASYHLPFQLPQSPPATPKFMPAASIRVQATDSSHSGCKVPQCRIVSCRLVSHAHFRPSQEQPSKERDCRHHLNRSSTAPHKVQVNRPTRSFSDGGSPNSNLGQSLHRFFTDMFEPAPPNFRRAFGTILPAYKFDTLTPVLSSEPFCIALTLLACTNDAIAHQYFVEVRTAMVLYTKALAGFRTMLVEIQSSHNPEQIEFALIIISILLSYDALYAKFHELKLHRDGMQKLVQLRGGLDYLTISLPYVVHFDRLSATMLNLSPAFSQQITPELRSPRLSWSQHGAKFAQMRQQNYSGFSMRTLEHCESTSNLIRTCETLSQEQTPDGENGFNRSYMDIEYFCLERDRVDEDFATIHAQMFAHDSIDKCVLWAARIVEYPVTWSNYCPTYIGLLFEKLLESMRAPELRNQWSEQTDVLTWVLFVMAISLTDFEGRSEVVTCLQDLLRSKYGSQFWTGDWWEMELENLRGFVWCDNYFEQRYDALCREIEGGSPT